MRIKTYLPGSIEQAARTYIWYSLGIVLFAAWEVVIRGQVIVILQRVVEA